MPQKVKANVLFVEVDKEDSRPLGTTKELNGAILSLGAQLGFQELLRRARVTRAILQSRLNQDSEDENRYQLRALIEAYGFMERQYKQESGRPLEEAREAYQDERMEYERLAKYVEIIGRNQEAN
jgi:bisphosphoglycerate-dependent phosphoglycerate mutase